MLRAGRSVSPVVKSAVAGILARLRACPDGFKNAVYLAAALIAPLLRADPCGADEYLLALGEPKAIGLQSAKVRPPCVGHPFPLQLLIHAHSRSLAHRGRVGWMTVADERVVLSRPTPLDTLTWLRWRHRSYVRVRQHSVDGERCEAVDRSGYHLV